MMRKWSLLSVVLLVSMSGFSYEWKFKDGENSKVVKETSDSKLNGVIYSGNLTNWGREDDRGWFLTMQGGASVRIPHSDVLNFKDGFHARMIFSCDLNKTGRGNFQNLFTKGANFQQGYSIMVYKTGDLLLNLRGLQPEYKIVKTGFQSNREYKLDIYVGKGKARIFVDDVEKASYPYTGDFNYAGNDKPLFIGQGAVYGLSGNVYYFMIEPYVEPGETVKRDQKKTTLESFKEQPLPLPSGAVVFHDFTKFEPASALKIGTAYSAQLNTWVCRAVSFAKHSTYTLHPPQSIHAPHLTYFPNLKGKYDIYVNVRAVTPETIFQVRLSNMKDWFTVKTLSVGGKHRNLDICLEQNVPMDGLKLELASSGDMAYISSFKFIPSGKLANPQPQDPAGIVERNERLSDKTLKEKMNREIDRKIQSGFFRERIWTDTRPQIKIGEKSKTRGFVLFEQPWMDLLFPQAKPSSDPGSFSLSVKAAQGEFEPVSFGIHALRPLNKVTLTLAREFGSGVTAEICRVDMMDKRTTNYVGQTEYMNGPQFLEKDNTMSIKGNESRQYWITLKVDANAAPGTRKGELLLTADGKTEKIPVTLSIYPFRLQPVNGYDIGFWTAMSIETPQMIDEIVKEMTEHGMTTIAVSGIFALNGNSADSVKIDFAKSKVTSLAEAYKRHGMTGHLMLPCDQLRSYGPETLKRLVKSVEAYAKAHNWAPIIWTSHDEVPSHPEQFPAFLSDLKALKEIGVTVYADHLWYKTTRPIEKQVAEAAQYIDIFLLRYNTRNYFYAETWDQIQTECARKNKKLYAYNSNNAITFPQPAAMRFASGWFFRSFGDKAKGQIVWAYNFPSGSPFTDLDSDSGDWVYSYPAFDGHKGGYAIDYEAFREGCDDLRYIQTLESAIDEARKLGRNAEADRAQKVIDNLKNSFDKQRFLKESVYFTSQWEKKWNQGNKLYASGNYNLPNGWAIKDYAKARDIIAAEIVKLNKMIGK